MISTPKAAECQIAEMAATKIQAGIKGFLARKDFERKKQAATKIEANFRSYLVRKEFKNRKKAAITLQSTYRGRQARKSISTVGQMVNQLFDGTKYGKRV